VPSVVACLMAIAAQAGTFTDNFYSNHDYRSNGVAGTPWSGITAGTSTPGTIDAWNANTTAANTLTITNTGGEWADGGDGPYLWTTVQGSGDFTNTVHVSNLAQINYNFAGLMVRIRPRPATGSTSPCLPSSGLNWIGAIRSMA